ncbi:hypothetical protein [Dactylosporangium sp. CS-033363]|uniref:hypothetical protein n=1 Tax=Dactylosporangium sp. CS-033363 TaxID=3239935 RepID=UPI003D91DB6A
MDGYCERLGPGLWAEPLNAVSNAAFLVACAVLLVRTRPGNRHWTLPVILGVVGLCSLSFHTFANGFTAALDTLSILVFVLVGVVLLARYGLKVPANRAWLAAPAFVVFAAFVDVLLGLAGRQYTLGGYLPALLGLAGFAVALRSPTLGLAAAVFAVSLTLRTLDEPLCGSIPVGLHWAWHCLNAVVLYLVAVSVNKLRWLSDSSTPERQIGT